jgi:RNA polymerase sigma-70 factor (ECF subfamily)
MLALNYSNTYISAKIYKPVLPSDKELIAGLHNSDENVYETIFRTYYERLCNYANSIVTDMDEAEEIVQNTFLIIWEKREDTEIHTSLKSYLYQSVHNHCLNRIKHFKIRKQYSQHYQSSTDINVESTSDTVIGNELNLQINDAIESLPKQCKAIFKLSRFENLTYAEIAEQMGLSVKTVDNHMVRALKFLRERLKEYIPYLLWFMIFKN